MLRYDTQKACFSPLVHLARKRSGSILTTPEPAWGCGQYQSTHITRLVMRQLLTRFVGVLNDIAEAFIILSVGLTTERCTCGGLVTPMLGRR